MTTKFNVIYKYIWEEEKIKLVFKSVNKTIKWPDFLSEINIQIVFLEEFLKVWGIEGIQGRTTKAFKNLFVILDNFIV